MQSSNTAEKSLNQIQTLLASGPNLDAKEINTQDFSRIISKMPNRHDKANINAVFEKLFEIASNKLKDDSDKAVLEGLKKYVQMAQEDLLIPKPRYLDAFFFPNEKNVDKLVAYIGKARTSLCVCVFNLTADRLANAIYDAHARGVKVRVISDDETMTNKGNDIQWLAD
jgi:mitochondrial cardiolipin hydrolase